MATRASEIYREGAAAGWRRERRLTVSEWSNTNRILSSVASAEPGRWRTSRTPYLREPMDCLSPDSLIERVVMMFGAQLGKTETGNNWIGHVIDQSPAPMLMVQPTVEVAKRVSKQRIAPMIESTPCLAAKVKESRSRDSGNTVQVKQFEGGVLILTGANSGAGLRSMPIRFLFMDEVDEYPGDVDGQGDPVALAERRTATFSRRKILLTSTPTIKGLSRIEREYLRSDQRRYFIPCPHCGHMDWIRWENIRWEKGKPDTAKLACIQCSELVEEKHKTEMLARGEWRATAEGSDRKTAGFHLSSLYSPMGWRSWADCVREFESAKDDPFRLKTWVNTTLGETWEERGESVDPDALKARRERYEAEVPDGVGILIAAVDVQGDRLEAVIYGFGAAEEGWLIAFSQFMGDPATPKVWEELTRFLIADYDHASGQKVRVELCVIDSGGHHTEEVYRYCKVSLAGGHRRYPVKGGSVSGKPLVERPSATNRYRIPLYVLCVDTGKDIITARLRIGTPSPGFIHLPEWVDDEFIDQLTAEKKIRKYVKGRGSVGEYVKLRERNEALDLTVYALSGLYICGPATVRSLPDRAGRLSVRVEPGAAPKPTAAAPILRSRRPRGWVNRW